MSQAKLNPIYALPNKPLHSSSSPWEYFSTLVVTCTDHNYLDDTGVDSVHMEKLQKACPHAVTQPG